MHVQCRFEQCGLFCCDLALMLESCFAFFNLQCPCCDYRVPQFKSRHFRVICEKMFATQWFDLCQFSGQLTFSAIACTCLGIYVF